MNINSDISKWIKFALIILVAFLSVETISALKDLGDLDPVFNSISVTGEGEAFSIPDIATFSFSVSSDGRTVSEAQTQVTKKMNSILTQLEDRDISDRDIKTTNYSVEPKYRYDDVVCITTPCLPSRNRIQDGYTVRHDVSLKIREVSEAGEILAMVGELGVSNLSGLSLTVDDPDQVVEEARALAIEDAKEKAEELADQLGVRLVRVVNFYDNGGGFPYYAGEAFGGDVAVLRSASFPTPEIPVGENKTVVSVTIIYEIR